MADLEKKTNSENSNSESSSDSFADLVLDALRDIVLGNLPQAAAITALTVAGSVAINQAVSTDPVTEQIDRAAEKMEETSSASDLMDETARNALSSGNRTPASSGPGSTGTDPNSNSNDTSSSTASTEQDSRGYSYSLANSLSPYQDRKSVV